MNDYSRELVEDLLQFKWDEHRFYGPVQNEMSPDHDMPRSPASKAHTGGWMAELADINRAWQNAPLTDTQRRRLFLRYGMGLTYEGVSVYDHVSLQNAAKVCDAGLETILVYLNGTEVLA